MTMLMKKLCDLTNLCLFVFACFEKESFFVVSRNDFTENLRKKGHFFFFRNFPWSQCWRSSVALLCHYYQLFFDKLFQNNEKVSTSSTKQEKITQQRCKEQSYFSKHHNSRCHQLGLSASLLINTFFHLLSLPSVFLINYAFIYGPKQKKAMHAILFLLI